MYRNKFYKVLKNILLQSSDYINKTIMQDYPLTLNFNFQIVGKIIISQDLKIYFQLLSYIIKQKNELNKIYNNNQNVSLPIYLGILKQNNLQISSFEFNITGKTVISENAEVTCEIYDFNSYDILEINIPFIDDFSTMFCDQINFEINQNEEQLNNIGLNIDEFLREHVFTEINFKQFLINIQNDLINKINNNFEIDTINFDD